MSVFSFSSLKLCMVTLLRYGYPVDNSQGIVRVSIYYSYVKIINNK